jgi:hypothetical protein
MTRRTSYGAPNLEEDNRYRKAHRSVGRDLMRCPHLTKLLQADGNSLWCEDCQRIVGFMRLPRKRPA